MRFDLITIFPEIFESIRVSQIWQKAEKGLDHRPLAEGEEPWRSFIDIVRGSGRDHHLLLEFVRGGTVDQFLEDGRTLRTWLK